MAFLDPACGCGNFLVVAYRELRRLELDVLKAAAAFGERIGQVFDFLRVDVDQFFGIEIEEFPAQIAQVAMWLTDHQMNVEAGEAFGEAILRIPLTKSAHIRHGNALRIDWAEFVPAQRLSYILGNPPFLGKQMQDAAQKEDLATVTQGLQGAGVLDFVAGWYIKAGRYLTEAPNSFGAIATQTAGGRRKFKDVRFSTGPGAGLGDLFADADASEIAARRAVRCAFVSTNSITQGEQVGVLWGWMLAQGLHIQFAHRTFKWTNEAPGRAAVHCVIVGFGVDGRRQRRLFEYPEIDKPPLEVPAQNINPYLADAPDVVLPSRKHPLDWVRPLSYGSFALDDGNFTLSASDREAVLASGPGAESLMRRFVGGQELLNGGDRWCLWMYGASPGELRVLPEVMRRVEAVRLWRLASERPTTRRLAEMPTRFAEVRQPLTRYVAIPTVCSERRRFVPIAYLEPDVIASNQVYVLPDAGLAEFGILSSTMHNAWIRCTCGRLKSDFRYSAGIVYNNFPWPLQRDAAREAAVARAAQAVLDARAVHAGSSLADLYDPNTMPPDLVKAHRELDRAVDAAYLAQLPPGVKTKPNLDSDAQRVAYLFSLYKHLTEMEQQAPA